MKRSWSRLSVLYIIVFCLSGLSSCKEEEVVSGCTDVLADNYSSDATEDDGSCDFSATAYFTFTFEYGTKELLLSGVNSIDLEVDGQYIGTYQTQFHNAGVPCGQAGLLTFETPLSARAVRTFELEVFGPQGQLITVKNFELRPGECMEVVIG